MFFLFCWKKVNSNSLFYIRTGFRFVQRTGRLYNQNRIPIAKYYFSADESFSYWDVQDAFLQEQEKKESQSEPGSD